MAKMSKTQRTAILEAHERSYRKGLVLRGGNRTGGALVRRGWATGLNLFQVTRAGLIAAGVDLDAIHAEALRNAQAVDGMVRAVGSNGTPLWQIKGTSMVVAGAERKRPTWIALYVLAEPEPEQVCATCGAPLDWTDPDTGTCTDPECGDEWASSTFAS